MKLILILLFAFSLKVHAADGVFLEGVSSSIDTPSVYRQLKQAFIARRWQVIDPIEHGVIGRINHRGVKAKVRIYKSGADLLFTCEGTKNTREHNSSTGFKSKINQDYCPHRWIDNLRKDIRWLLKSSQG
ncbi:MAG: hypothetical protein K6L76_03320 [Agarilytica sp.]